MNVNGISLGNTGAQGFKTQNRQGNDSYSKNIQNQITNAQKQMQELGENKESTASGPPYDKSKEVMLMSTIRQYAAGNSFYESMYGTKSSDKTKSESTTINTDRVGKIVSCCKSAFHAISVSVGTKNADDSSTRYELWKVQGFREDELSYSLSPFL